MGTAPHRETPGSRARPRILWYRPELESLEDRRLLAAVSWMNFMGGDWDTASNWSSHAVPGPNDDVTIGGIMGTVTHSSASSVSDSIRSLNDAAPLSFTTGSLTISSNLPGGGPSVIGGAFTATNGTSITVQPLTSGGNPIPATLEFTAGATLSGSSSLETLAGATLEFFGTASSSVDASSTIGGLGSVILFGGTMTVNGTFALTNTSTLPNSSTTVSGGASLDFTPSSHPTPGALAVVGGSTATFDVGASVNGLTLGDGTGAGTLNGLATVTVQNGSLNWAGGTMGGTGTTVIYGGVNHTMSGNGAKSLAGARTFEIRNALVTWTDSGGFSLAGGTTLVTDVNGGEFNDATIAPLGGTGGPTITNGWKFRKTAAGAQTITSTFNNYGPDFEVDAGTLTLVGNANFVGNSSQGSVAAGSSLIFTGGTYLFQPGSLSGGTVGGGGSVEFAAGTAEVDSAVTPAQVKIDAAATVIGIGHLGNTTNLGLINPGTPTAPAATLFIDGTYTQGAGGALHIDLAGETAYDRLVISGAATLSGGLSVSFLGTFNPAPGDVFTFMTYASVTGDFGAFAIQGPGIPVKSGTHYDVDY